MRNALWHMTNQVIVIMSTDEYQKLVSLQFSEPNN